MSVAKSIQVNGREYLLGPVKPWKLSLLMGIERIVCPNGVFNALPDDTYEKAIALLPSVLTKEFCIKVRNTGMITKRLDVT